ncbi:MAG: general secretion pathway protein A [Motiliproteus sp.]|jgi:general secretion pathway protein A
MYKSHFGLLTNPFQLSPDPDFFFGSAGHKRAMAYLQYGLGQGEGFIVITGEIGTGKTTLMRNLLKNIDPDHIIAAQLVTTRLEADDLLRLICSAFGLPAADRSKAALLLQFEDFLLRTHNAGKRVLLVVDEAQNLSSDAVEELRMLSNFQLTDSPLLQSFLLGQPELRRMIQRPDMEQFRQRIIAFCHLKPLETAEVKEYILWRLTVAGWVQNPKFTDTTFAVIQGHTGGVPRRLNIFCDRLLLFCYLEEISTIGVDAVNTVAAELADEMNPPIDSSQTLIAGLNATACSEGPAPTPPLSSLSMAQIEEIEQKISSINSFVNRTLKVKLELIRTLDTKLKQKINQLVD